MTYDIFPNPSGHRESFCLLAPLTKDAPFPVQDDSDDSDDDDSDSDEKPAAKPAAKAAAKPASSDDDSDDDDDDSDSDDSDDKPAAKPAAAKPAAKAADSDDVRVSLHPLRQRSLVSLLLLLLLFGSLYRLAARTHTRALGLGGRGAADEPSFLCGRLLSHAHALCLHVHSPWRTDGATPTRPTLSTLSTLCGVRTLRLVSIIRER